MTIEDVGVIETATNVGELEIDTFTLCDVVKRNNEESTILFL